MRLDELQMTINSRHRSPLTQTVANLIERILARAPDIEQEDVETYENLDAADKVLVWAKLTAGGEKDLQQMRLIWVTLLQRMIMVYSDDPSFPVHCDCDFTFDQDGRRHYGSTCDCEAAYFFKCDIGDELTARCEEHCSGRFAESIDDCDPITFEEFKERGGSVFERAVRIEVTT